MANQLSGLLSSFVVCRARQLCDHPRMCCVGDSAAMRVDRLLFMLSGVAAAGPWRPWLLLFGACTCGRHLHDVVVCAALRVWEETHVWYHRRIGHACVGGLQGVGHGVLAAVSLRGVEHGNLGCQHASLHLAVCWRRYCL